MEGGGRVRWVRGVGGDVVAEGIQGEGVDLRGGFAEVNVCGLWGEEGVSVCVCV